MFSCSRFVRLIINQFHYFNEILLIIVLFLIVDGKTRRRRQYLYNNNFGNYAVNPAGISYYNPNGADIYSNNVQQNNRFVVGGVAYQFPTPVNVMSGGQYNPQQYNVYPSGGNAYYYRKKIS